MSLGVSLFMEIFHRYLIMMAIESLLIAMAWTLLFLFLKFLKNASLIIMVLTKRQKMLERQIGLFAFLLSCFQRLRG